MLAVAGAAALLWWFRPGASPGGPDLERPVIERIVAGRIDEARRLIDEARAHWPGSARVALAEARVAYHQGDAAGVTRALDAARAAGADAFELERWSALIAARADGSADAEARLVRLLERSTRPEPEACELLARRLLSTYRFRPAALVLDRWARDSATDPRPYLWMTEIDRRAETGGPAAAAVHYRMALERAPANREARRGLADALRETHEAAEAIELYSSLLADDPRDEAARLGRARALVAEGRADEASADLEAVSVETPEGREAARELAAIELSRGDAAGALARLDRVLAEDPFDAEAHYRRGLALDRLARPDEAGAARAEAARLREDEKALTDLQHTFNVAPTDALRCRIGRWLLEHGRPREAVRWARTVLDRLPGHREANALAADAHEALGESGLANFHRLQAGGRAGQETGP